MPTKPRKDDRVTKRRVTMVNPILVQEGGETVSRLVTAVDFVRPDLLDAYVTDAKRRWQSVTVSEEPDAGPAGYDGATFVPFGVNVPKLDRNGAPTGESDWHEFPHELAGSFYPATDCKKCDHAPEHPLTGVRARTIRAEA